MNFAGLRGTKQSRAESRAVVAGCGLNVDFVKFPGAHQVAVGGAVTGTLFPQIGATINMFDTHSATSAAQLAEMLINGVWILAGVTTTLVYFHFGARTTSDGSARRFALIELIAFVGSIFLAITLGVLFAGVYSAALTALIDRFHFFGTLFGLH